MKQNNNTEFKPLSKVLWCCEIVGKTFKIFREKKLYENVWERNDIFHYWRDIDFDKQFCKKCEKSFEKEYSRFRADAKKEEERLDKIVNKCDNCKKSIKLKDKEGEVKNVYESCREHGNYGSCFVVRNNFCSLKCLKVAEKKIKECWL